MIDFYKEIKIGNAFIKETLQGFLNSEFRKLIISKSYDRAINILCCYFNNYQEELQKIDPAYTIKKNIMLIGDVGTGKTILMRAFKIYTNKLNKGKRFTETSMSEFVQYYRINNHIDKFTYGFNNNQKPLSFCFNELGLNKLPAHYGISMQELVEDLLMSRDDIKQRFGNYFHITTNLTPINIGKMFFSEIDRINDRFKDYNVIVIEGKSNRK